VTDDKFNFSFKASGAGAGVFSGKLYSIASSSTNFSSNSEGCLSAGSEGPASALAWPTAASTSAGFVSTSAIFPQGIELEAFTDSSISSTLAILFLLGVVVRPFCASGTATSAEGLKTSNVFVPSILGSSILSVFGSANLAEGAFGIAANSSIFCVGAGPFASIDEEVSLLNSGTMAGSI
jgi:hypothetical protein